MQRGLSQVKTPTTPTTEINEKDTLNPDGNRKIYWPNGNLKEISADRMVIKLWYFNDDIKEANINDGTMKYYFVADDT